MDRTIFLSYSSAQSAISARIELALAAEGYSVFRDRTSLPPGESFDAQIRDAIDDCDLFVFLISREAVAAGHYTLTELKFAEQKWQHPSGHVLPVLLDDTPIEAVPEYLRAVTILTVRGDVGAEVAAEAHRILGGRWRLGRGAWRTVAALLIVLLGIAAWQGSTRYAQSRRQAAQVASVVKQASLQSNAANYASAWKTLDAAQQSVGTAPAFIDAQEQLAMAWLDDARGSEGSLSLSQIAETVYPVLVRGAAAESGQRAADLMAHMGWADFLRSREGVGGLQPIAQYKRALDIEPTNAYAHAMWGFEIMRTGGPLSDAREHFRLALASKTHHDYVRHTQISAMLWSSDDEEEEEVVRVANDIREAGETMPVGNVDRSDTSRLWNVYYSRLINGSERAAFLNALSPDDHLATFKWLYPEEQFPRDKSLYHGVLGQLEERAGHGDAARVSYQFVVDDFAKSQSTGRLLDVAKAGLKRVVKSK